jgi:zinc protease
MSEATTERSAAEFTEALERIGATIRVNTNQYETTVTLNTLSKHIDTAMALMRERILQPDFNQQDFERVKGRTLEELAQNRKTPQGLASRATASVLLGPTHPLSYPQGGLPSTVTGISLEDVRAFYAASIPAHLSGVLVSADLDQAEVIAALQELAGLAVSAPVRAPLGGIPEMGERRLYLVNKEGAAQSSVRTIQPSLKFDALGDHFRAGLMNFNLGGAFSSRINQNLREEKGYTYGASTRFQGGPEVGSFGFSAEINRDATGAAITEVLNEMEAFAAEGMTEAEFEFMRKAIGQRDALRYETPAAKLGLLGDILRYDLPLDYRTQQKDLLQETSRETLNGLAARLIRPDAMAVVVVGDQATIRPVLEALGMPITELDEDGFVIGD